MSEMRRVIQRLVHVLRVDRAEEDLDRELDSHAGLLADEYRRRGLSDADARTAARRALGGIARTKELHRDARSLTWIDDARLDARYALRSLSRAPGFAAVAILTLALGIGAATTISSIVNTILLEPLPFPNSDRLVRVVENVPSRIAGRPPARRGVTYQEFLEWRSRARTLTDPVAVVAVGPRSVRGRDGAARLWEALVSTDAFTTLGARPALGRFFGAEDAANPNVAVISHETWRSFFHADATVIGTTVEVDAAETMFAGSSVGRRLITVVGVLPNGFQLPTGAVDLYCPVVAEAGASPGVTFLAFLAPGVSLPDAISEANVVGGAIRPPRAGGTSPNSTPRFDVIMLKDQIVQGLRPALRVLLCAVAVVLLIVCTNLASLLLARGTTRQQEIAVRVAIGASRGRIVRQVLTECVVLAMAGAGVGALLAAGGVTLVRQLASVDAPGIFRVVFGRSILPRIEEVGVHARMFAIAFAVAALASVLFGVLPALDLSRRSDPRAIGARTGPPGRRAPRVRAGLVVAQFAMATVLLVGAGLLVRAFVKLATVNNGYNPSNVVTFQLVLPAEYPTARKGAAIEAILTRLRAAPGVQSAGVTRAGVLIPEEIYVGTLVPPGRTVDEMRADQVKPRIRPSSDGYLTAMGVPLLEGRELRASDDDTASPVIVVSRSVARRYFGSRRATGQRVNWYGNTGSVVSVEVVGVVEDVRNESPDSEANPDVFVNYRQLLGLSDRLGIPRPRREEIALGFSSFAVRVRGATAAAAAPAIGQVVRAVDPDAVADGLVPMDRLMTSALARPRFYAVTLGLFAAVAGFLAAIGIYGVLSYTVAQRTREIGVRMALGARRAEVLRLVMQTGSRLAVCGIAIGMAGAAATTRVLGGMLFGVAPLDAVTFAAVPLLFGAVALYASYVPARRATLVDPLVALRCE